MKQPAGFIPSFAKLIVHPRSKPTEVPNEALADAVSGLVVLQEDWAEEWKALEEKENAVHDLQRRQKR